MNTSGMNSVVRLFACAVCKRKVDEVIVIQDILNDVYNVTVKCHGEIEKVTLCAFDIANANDIKVGLAFEKASPRSKKGPRPPNLISHRQ